MSKGSWLGVAVASLFGLWLSWSADPAFAQRLCPTCLPGQPGDIVHRKDTLTPGWIGHAGVYVVMIPEVAGARIADFSTGRKPGKAFQLITFDAFVAGQPFWGAKRHTSFDAVRANLLAQWVRQLQRMRTEYDGDHMNQKGKVFGSGGAAYHEADCVGFVEDAMERFGINLTPDAFESGLGWPLTVEEQRDESSAANTR